MKSPRYRAILNAQGIKIKRKNRTRFMIYTKDAFASITFDGAKVYPKHLIDSSIVESGMIHSIDSRYIMNIAE